MATSDIATLSASADAAGATPTQVFVRMYRGRLPGEEEAGWLGDCFLIRLLGPAGASHILIDCGILPGSPRGGERMRAVVDDIARTTGGKLDLVVVTHQHADHISGFIQAREAFFGDKADGTPPKLEIGRVWMAWTEKRGDPLADDLRQGLGKRSEAFAKLAEHLRNSAGFGSRPDRATLGLDAFLDGIVDPASGGTDGLGVAGGRLTGTNVLEVLAAEAPTEYREPGEGLFTPGAISLYAHVLAPPRTKERLFKEAPSGGTARETYLAATAANEAAIIAQFAPNEGGLGEIDSPFSRAHAGILAEDVQQFEPSAGGSADNPRQWLRERYYEPRLPGAGDQSRRRIDDDWLAASGAFALKLDSDTNNTSLVLAFALPDDSFLLFAADAQVGNWLSWHDQPYRTADGTSIEAREILRRTRLYKVGHHGSHNATLRDQGLELMEHPELVAMLPTDEAFGRTRPGEWKMPDATLNGALNERTGGRILRNDRTYAPPPGSPPDADFVAKLSETPMFIEYRAF